MNWITKFIKPKIKSLFEKRSSRVEDNLWTTCSCKNLIIKKTWTPILRFVLNVVNIINLLVKKGSKLFFDNKEFELIETPLPKE